MANLFELDDKHPQLHNLTSPARVILFGVIKREIFAVEEIGVEENIGEYLQPGTLIQIKPGYHSDECHFKIRNFTNWREKYKTTIYKCKKPDYITIKEELWPYLIGFNNDARLLKLVEDINKTEFDLDMLKLGGEVQIRGPPGNEGKYYEFVVAYNGLMKEISARGYHIGLQLKNDRVPLTSDLNRLSEYYRFGGIGIVVQIDWIMLNLYTEEERLKNKQLKKTTKTAATLKQSDAPPEPSGETEFNADRAIEISEPESIPNTRQLFQGDPPPEPSGETEFNANEVIEINEPETIPIRTNTHQLLQNDFFEYMLNKNPINWRNNDESHFVPSSPINKQTKIEIGATTNYNALKIEFNNNVDEVVKMSETLTRTRTLPIGSKFSKKTFESIALSKHRLMSPKTPYDTTLNYDANIEPVTNADGAMRNKEKTICGVCSITVEIGDGFTLRGCKHLFCTDCIRFHVKERNSKESKIRCPYKKGYQCDFSLQDAEIKDFREEAIYNKIPGNRLKQSKSNVAELYEVYKNLDILNHQKSWVQPTNVQSKIPYETGYSSKQFDQSPENKFNTTLSYAAEIESITNADGAVKNAEKTKCDYCHITVEIGHGIILRECLHSFCTKCIRAHVNCNLKCSSIRCPYKQDYECEFDLQDAEIKDLGGETIYNTILDSRLKEFMATEPNTMWCPDKACKNVWVRQPTTHQRCPKCNVNFCLICKNAHEPDQRHENNPIKTTFFGKMKKVIRGTRKNTR